MQVYLLRHGRTSATGTYTGISDVDLTTEGAREIQNIAGATDLGTGAICFCSPLRRCRQTADFFDMKGKITYDSALREIDFGRWEGRTFTEIAREDPDTLQLWLEQKEYFTFPGGERVIDFMNRVNDWFDQLLKRDSDRVFIVSHGGVIRQAICHLLGLDQEFSFQFEIKEGGISLISCEQGFNQLRFLNRRGV